MVVHPGYVVYLYDEGELREDHLSYVVAVQQDCLECVGEVQVGRLLCAGEVQVGRP